MVRVMKHSDHSLINLVIYQNGFPLRGNDPAGCYTLGKGIVPEGIVPHGITVNDVAGQKVL